MASTQPLLNYKPSRVARLKRALQRAGIPQQAVATEAGVGKDMVSHCLAGRYTSSKVIAAAEKLLADRRSLRRATNGAQEKTVRQDALPPEGSRDASGPRARRPAHSAGARGT